MATDSHQTPFVSPHPHRTELKDTKVLIVASYTHLTVEHRTFAIQFNPNGKNQKERTQHNKSQSTCHNVKQSFQHNDVTQILVFQPNITAIIEKVTPFKG
jgi:hypothetical protein